MIRNEVYEGGAHVRTLEIERTADGVVFRRLEPPGEVAEERMATESEKQRLRARLEDKELDRVRDRAEQALDTLEQIASTSGDLTRTQLSNAVRVIARVLAALIRFILRKLDVTL